MDRGDVNESYLPCVELEPPGPARSAVVWLHGLGADGHDFEPIVPHLRLAPEVAARFVFPHAPRRPVTVNMGLIMPAWYDIGALDPREADERGVRESARQVRALIARENERGVPTERIVLAGFSQGGAVALHVGLRHPERLAGILALSTYLVLEETVEAERHEANAATPVFQAHGVWDPMIPIHYAEATRDRLVELGYSVEWRSYPTEHAVHPEEIRDIGARFNRWLGD